MLLLDLGVSWPLRGSELVDAGDGTAGLPRFTQEAAKNEAKMHNEKEGLAQDLPRLMGRRGVLLTLAGAGIAGFAIAQGAPPSDVEANVFGPDKACLKTPRETNGPYPADGSNTREGQVVDVLKQQGVIRDDIRASFGDLSGTADGIPLKLEIALVDVAGCTPLVGHAIYLWHATAAGQYSLYDLPDQNFLRGVVLTDAGGVARVTTIVPGCYDGRWPHIHFEVFASAEAATQGMALLTSQMALPEAVCRQAYADARYPASLQNLDDVTLVRDMVFGDNTAEQVAQQTLAMSETPTGYAAKVTVGLA
jgi:protocatechuate 3,4-dioxygenase beta subunit